MKRALLPLVAAAVVFAPAAHAQQPVNPIHPQIVPLDAAGRPVRSEQGLSVEKTCGACHDAAYIASHTGHVAPKASATCVQCHADGGRLDVRPETLEADGRLKRTAIRIGAPRPESCGACHGVVADATAALALPADFEAALAPGRSLTLTQGEGAIVSPQRIQDSFLNVEGKDALARPWDVHAAKLVDCVACHFAANNPARSDAKRAPLPYLSTDPRRLGTAEYLVRPDHRLTAQGCRSCHDPAKGHEFLAYRARHMAALACESCHAAAARAPVLEMVDATVATAAGEPALRFRNLARGPGEALNAAVVRPFEPILVERVEADGARRLAPFNTVARWRWVSGPERVEVPFDRVAAAFLDGARYAPAIVEAFDVDRDRRLDGSELRLDSGRKAKLVADRLAALGVAEPRVDGTLEVFPLAHGISTRDGALRDCDACHAEASRLAGDGFAVASYLPGGTPPRPPEDGRVDLASLITSTPSGGLALRTGGSRTGLHVLGHTRQGLTNTLGFGLFLAVVAGVSIHGLARFLLRRRRADAAPRAAGERQYLFGRYERLWHWTMALAGVVLILTGLAVHAGERFRPVDLPTAVAIHNAFAVILMANGFLALFYHLATATIRNLIPHPHGFLERVLAHMSYQARGIFYGESHPPNAPGHKLNPLQQVTYLALLNVLFPLQIVTGVLIWAVGQWPSVAAAVGGLSVVAPLHNAGSWLFLSFFVLHAYLVTTGRTATDHLKSMITGYGHLHTEPTP